MEGVNLPLSFWSISRCSAPHSDTPCNSSLFPSPPLPDYGLLCTLLPDSRERDSEKTRDIPHSNCAAHIPSTTHTHARTQTPLPARCDRALHTDQTDTNTLRAGSWLPLRRCCSSARLRCRPCLSIAILYSDSHCSFLTANQGASEADLCAITARHYLPGNRHSLIRARTSPSLSRSPPEHNRVHPRINRNRD